ncbi:DUF3859 domain-containing protein [Salipiger sp. IMCC34102]|uniref:DUF3859 domain-containing protein n=1 Tax=Salipiger sp. IMCC34102 TaxID=2510647 RepID=UPI00101C37BD|nr:DUF3859 domain-containing protein [Salipiger sp. IMCC34102]RYH04323.1 DUF3859 domain-containing protein [Salipiger sp. IMCC34102]
MRLTLSLLLLLATPLAAQAPDTVSDRLSSFETGVICPPPSVGEAPAPGTVAGTTHLIEEEPPFVSNASRVPAVLGLGFGAKAQARGLGLADVEIEVTHPPMGPDGATRQSFRSRIDAFAPSLTFYQFDFAYELVQGLWQIEATKDGETLYRKTFEVVAPDQMPELARICGFENLLS